MNSTDYFLYDYSYPIHKETLMEDVKELFLLLHSLLSLNGYYKVSVIIKTIGVFLRVHFVEDTFYHKKFDMKVELIEEDVYYCTTDYDSVLDFSSILYYEGVYYGLVEDSFDSILEKVEFGYFRLKEEIEDSLRYGLIVK